MLKKILILVLSMFLITNISYSYDNSKIDKVVDKFIVKIEKKYKSEESRIKIIDKVVGKIGNLKNNKKISKSKLDLLIYIGNKLEKYKNNINGEKSELDLEKELDLINRFGNLYSKTELKQLQDYYNYNPGLNDNSEYIEGKWRDILVVDNGNIIGIDYSMISKVFSAFGNRNNQYLTKKQENDFKDYIYTELVVTDKTEELSITAPSYRNSRNRFKEIYGNRFMIFERNLKAGKLSIGEVKMPLGFSPKINEWTGGFSIGGSLSALDFSGQPEILKLLKAKTLHKGDLEKYDRVKIGNEIINMIVKDSEGRSSKSDWKIVKHSPNNPIFKKESLVYEPSKVSRGNQPLTYLISVDIDDNLLRSIRFNGSSLDIKIKNRKDSLKEAIKWMIFEKSILTQSDNEIKKIIDNEIKYINKQIKKVKFLTWKAPLEKANKNLKYLKGIKSNGNLQQGLYNYSYNQHQVLGSVDIPRKGLHLRIVDSNIHWTQTHLITKSTGPSSENMLNIESIFGYLYNRY